MKYKNFLQLTLVKRIFFSVGPSSVEIRGLEGPVSAGKLLRVECEAKGSRPPATLTWWLDGTMLTSTSQVVSKTFFLLVDVNIGSAIKLFTQ